MTFFKESAFQDFTIGKVPEEWQIESLQALLVQLKNGLTLKQNKEQNGYPITRIETISQGVIDPERVGYVPDINTKDVEEYRLLKGDLLFSHINSVEHIGKVALYEGSPETLFHGMNLLLLRPNKEKINSDYLLYALRYLKVKNLFSSIAKKAVNQASINQTELGKVRIPIPSLPEQRAIVGVLGVVDSAIEYADRVIAKTERLKRGLMQQLLTRGIGHTETKQTPIGRLPEEWKIAKLADVSQEVIIGNVNPATPFYTTEKDVPYFRSQNVRENNLTPTATYVKKEFNQIHPKSVLRENDVLTVQTGFIGTSCLVPKRYEGSNCHSLLITRTNPQSISPEFLCYFLNSDVGKKDIMKHNAGWGRNHLLLEDFRKAEIPIPPLAEQLKIVDILSTAYKKVELEKIQRIKLEQIKAGMMDLLLTGKIRIKVD